MRKLFVVLAFLLGALSLGYGQASTAAPSGPDLIPVLDPYFTTEVPFITTETYLPEDCAVQEGFIAAGTHKLLRFATSFQNIGDRDLRIGRPTSHVNDGWYTWSPCHGHYHFNNYASYRLLGLDGSVVATGHKMGFCIIDALPPLDWTLGRVRFNDCDNQGLSAGWYDRYAPGLEGQWIEIDDVPPGTYQIEITVNYANQLPESNYANNTQVLYEVVIP